MLADFFLFFPAENLNFHPACSLLKTFHRPFGGGKGRGEGGGGKDRVVHFDGFWTVTSTFHE
jgi:hypothetical protein